MPIYPTFNFVPCPWPKSCYASLIITDAPLCFMVWWTCWGPTRSPSPIQHHDPPHELDLFIFVLSLKITRLQSSMVQFSYLWANLRHARTCLRFKNGFLFCTCASNISNLSQSTPHNDVKQQFMGFRSKLFCYRRCSSKWTFSCKSDTRPFLSIYKKLWTPSSLSLNLAPYVLP